MARRTKTEIADDIREQESELARTTGFGPAGVDTAFVPDREAFNGYTHQQIWDKAHQVLDPDTLGQLADHWSKRSQSLHDIFDAFSQGVKRELGEWSGEFASSAQQSTNTYLAASLDAQQTADTVQRLMDLNSSAAQTVKAAIPPPPPPYQPSLDPAVEAADGGARLRAYQAAASAAQADAQDTMNFVYNPTIPASGDSVPRFQPPPPGPAAAPPAPGATGSPASPNSGQPTPGPGNAGTPGKDSNPSSGSPRDGQPSGQAQPPGNGQQPDSPAQTQPSADSPAATTPSAAASPVTGAGPGANTPTPVPGTMPTPGTGPGSTGGPAVPGLDPLFSGTPGAPGTGSPSAGGPGTSRPGQPAATEEPVNSPRGAQPTAARPMSSSGMPHAGGKKDSEEERSKSSPEYLRRQYEELGQLPDVPSGVIGMTPTEDQPPASAPTPEPTPEKPAAKPTVFEGRGPLDD